MNYETFAGKHVCQSLFFNKVAGLRSATLFKKILWHRSFPVNFVKMLRTSFLQNLWKTASKTFHKLSKLITNCLHSFSSKSFGRSNNYFEKKNISDVSQKIKMFQLENLFYILTVAWITSCYFFKSWEFDQKFTFNMGRFGSNLHK